MSKVEKVKNPATGRWISVGGARYQKLQEQQGLNRPLSTLTAVDRSSQSWASKKPSSRKERVFVREACGDACFLLPEQQKFPVCNKTLPCTYNCRGLKAASARAGQWKYEEVLKKSKELTETLGCYSTRNRNITRTSRGT